jgi:hypothetical protein
MINVRLESSLFFYVEVYYTCFHVCIVFKVPDACIGQFLFGALPFCALSVMIYFLSRLPSYISAIWTQSIKQERSTSQELANKEALIFFRKLQHHICCFLLLLDD